MGVLSVSSIPWKLGNICCAPLDDKISLITDVSELKKRSCWNAQGCLAKELGSIPCSLCPPRSTHLSPRPLGSPGSAAPAPSHSRLCRAAGPPSGQTHPPSAAVVRRHSSRSSSGGTRSSGHAWQTHWVQWLRSSLHIWQQIIYKWERRKSKERKAGSPPVISQRAFKLWAGMFVLKSTSDSG